MNQTYLLLSAVALLIVTLSGCVLATYPDPTVSGTTDAPSCTIDSDAVSCVSATYTSSGGLHLVLRNDADRNVTISSVTWGKGVLGCRLEQTSTHVAPGSTVERTLKGDGCPAPDDLTFQALTVVFATEPVPFDGVWPTARGEFAAPWSG